MLLNDTFKGRNSIELGYSHPINKHLTIMGGLSFQQQAQGLNPFSRNENSFSRNGLGFSSNLGLYFGTRFNIAIQSPYFNPFIEYKTNTQILEGTIKNTNWLSINQIAIQNQLSVGLSHTLKNGLELSASLGISHLMTRYFEQLEEQPVHKQRIIGIALTPSVQISLAIPLSIFKRKQADFNPNKPAVF